MDVQIQPLDHGDSTQRQEGLSYKFQRLRERLRQAILSGELNGKLPGERSLAERFDANPKTLSKALTDLAAEGLLERSIGRGTYVKGSCRTEPGGGRWMILCDTGRTDTALARAFQQACPGSEVVDGPQKLRPSFLNQFDTVIDLSGGSLSHLHRTFLVRGMSVLLIGRESEPYRTHGVTLDRAYAAGTLARDLLLGGHRSILVLEDQGQTAVSRAVRTTAARYEPCAAVQSCGIEELATHLNQGISAILCDGTELAEQARALLATRPSSPELRLVAVGVCEGLAPCTGIFVTPGEVVQAAAQLMAEARIHHPTTLWLSGTYVDRGTARAAAELRLETALPQPTVALSA
jgi:hypothetical protein